MKTDLSILAMALSLFINIGATVAKCTYTLKDTVRPESDNCSREPFDDNKTFHENWKSTHARNESIKSEDYLERIEDNPCLTDSTKCVVTKHKNTPGKNARQQR